VLGLYDPTGVTGVSPISAESKSREMSWRAFFHEVMRLESISRQRSPKTSHRANGLSMGKPRRFSREGAGRFRIEVRNHSGSARRWTWC